MNPISKQPEPSQGGASWSIRLNQLGLEGLASTLAEASRPLSPILAQLLHIANPLLDDPQSKARMQALAQRLEERKPKA